MDKEKLIIQSNLEDVMHESFMPYAEHVILERALPRVEDGLKPVQRRILYTMYELQIWPDSKYKKCARIVGECMGKYHPHGDSSIYEALARMAQDFSMRMMLIDGQGNFGSIDGDGPAAMRYTEARLKPIALEMLRDLEKETVPFRLNFDDTLKEPDMLPSRYPNLLVNGATGIAVGLATNIPPHNLGEVIDAAVERIQNPNATLDDMMQHIKGPDFPTGGKIMGTSEIREAYETGKGKIYLRAATHFEKGENGKTLLVITELPFEIKEANLLRKIQQLRETKKEMFAGIDDVRSESDRQGIRAVVSIKKNADPEKILECLLKYSDLQISYGMNMVAIADGQPKQLGLLEILDYYIDYQRKVVTARTRYDLEKAQEREHILAGLMIAVQNIDEVIKIIRASKNAKEAKQRLRERFSLTGIQAQAILDLRLARLTALEIETLQKEYAQVLALIEELQAILGSAAKLDRVIVTEMLDIKKKYADKRRTAIDKKSAEITIDVQAFKQAEDCAVVLTRDGNLKRLSPKAMQRGMAENTENDTAEQILICTTESKLRAFTNLGNLYSFKAEAIKECRYKDAGAALKTFIAGVEKNEQILKLYIFDETSKGQMLFVTRSGMVKFTETTEFDSKKSKISACGLKENDELILAELADVSPNLLLITRNGMSIRFKKDEISTMGRTGKGVGGIKLSPADEVVFAVQTAEEGNVITFTDTGYVKATRLAEYELQGRNGKGLKAINLMRNGENGTQIIAAFLTNSPCVFTAELESGEVFDLNVADIATEPRNSKGIQYIPAILGDTVIRVYKTIK